MIRTLLLSTVTALAGGLSMTPALASPEDLATIERACGTRLRLPPGGCACLRQRAGRLKDRQQAFVAAVVTKNKKEQRRLQAQLTVQEMTEAGNFMTTAPSQCARR